MKFINVPGIEHCSSMPEAVRTDDVNLSHTRVTFLEMLPGEFYV
jgi:hypothetical protein